MTTETVTIQSLQKELYDLRKAHELGHESAKKQIADALEKRDLQHATELAESKAKAEKAEALEKKLVELEADLKRGNFSGNGDAEPKAAKEKEEHEIKAFHSLLAKGQSGIGHTEMKYLRTDSAVEGGYLCPPEYANEIIKSITEFSDIRNIARVNNLTAKSIELPKRTGKPTAYWVGEGETATGSNSTYGIEELKAEKMVAYVDVTLEMVEDSKFDIKKELSIDVGDAMAEVEGAGYNSGNGVKKPFGFMSATGVSEYPSGNALGIDPDVMWTIQGELKKAYKPTWLLNRKTLFQHLAVMKGGDGQYLIKINDGMPNTFAGIPYAIDPNMPDVAAGTYPIVLADWQRFYRIVDSRIITVIEDNLTQATSGLKRFLFFRRTGGQVILPEAGIKLKIATSV